MLDKGLQAAPTLRSDCCNLICAKGTGRLQTGSDQVRTGSSLAERKAALTGPSGPCLGKGGAHGAPDKCPCCRETAVRGFVELASRGASRSRIVGRPTKHRFAIYQPLDEVDRRYLQPDLSPTRESLENGMRRVAEIDPSLGTMGEKDVQLAPRVGASLSARIGVRQETLLFDAKKELLVGRACDLPSPQT